MRSPSKVLKFHGFRWQGVEVAAYKAEGGGALFKDITRQTLFGHGEGEGDLNFITRYFEILPGGYSRLEKHLHPHVVMVLRGSGRVVLDRHTYEIAPCDCVYVAPGVFHQFQATGDEPLGFLCVVDRLRDRPQLSSDDERGRIAEAASDTEG